MKKLIISGVVGCLALTGAQASAASIVPCPSNPISASRDTYVNLTYSAPVVANCYDYGQSTENGNGQYSVTATGIPVVLDNNVLELPTGNVSLALGTYLSGTFDSGTSGSFTFLTGSTSPLYLALKTGGGQNDPYWFAFKLEGVTQNTVVSWNLVNGRNALSNTGLFGIPGTDPCANGGCDPDPDPDPLPEPTSIALLGLGLLGAGVARRRRQ